MSDAQRDMVSEMRKKAAKVTVNMARERRLIKSPDDRRMLVIRSRFSKLRGFFLRGGGFGLRFAASMTVLHR